MKLIDGQRVAELRKQRGWDQYELAEVAGVTSSMISRLERNMQEDYKLSAVLGIARALGVTIDSLLADEPRPEKQGLLPELQQAVDTLRQQPAEIQNHVSRIIRGYLSTFK